MKFIATAFLALASAFAPLALAQEPPERVGRLALAEGSVSVYQDPDMGWDQAYVNLPITSENSVWTDRGARAEVRVGGTALRLDELTQLDIARLDDDEIDVQIERGTVAIRVRFKQKNERFSFSTPHARFLLEAVGRYRIDVDPERDETRLTVFSGDARMESERGRVRVETGKTVVVWGSPSPSFAFERAETNAFDRWALARDEQWSAPRSTQYVSTNMTGYEDLDRYGEWVNEPEYGTLWFPTRVSSGWAPYREGRWAWVRPWGWTWVDEAPWGYAPFHYGRWVQVRNRWAWHPGRRVDRPTWAPALVAFVGGSNWNLSIGSGRSAPVVGWYPLSPWERYEPWYRGNASHVNRINVNVETRDRAPRQFEGRGDWRTMNRDRGTTVVERQALIDRRSVARAAVQVTPEAVRSQPVVPQAQVQRVLPQQNELARRRVEPGQARVAAPPAARLPTVGGAPAASARAGAATESNEARPRFSRREQARAPAPAAANQAPPSAQSRPVNPLATPTRGDESARRAQEEQQRQQKERAAGDARKDQERATSEAARETQRRDAERAAREGKQQQERAAQEAARETQRRDAERAAREGQQEQKDRAAREGQERAAREAQQQQERAAREGQQREAQQRAAREAQQQQQQERAGREAQQREAQQAAQRAAREAQQQQERATRETQQAGQRAAREAAQQQQEAAQRAAREAKEQAKPAPAQQGEAKANPTARPERPQARDKDKDKDDDDDKDKDKGKDRDRGNKR